jgi:hypothetical protein
LRLKVLLKALFHMDTEWPGKTGGDDTLGFGAFMTPFSEMLRRAKNEIPAVAPTKKENRKQQRAEERGWAVTGRRSMWGSRAAGALP